MFAKYMQLIRSTLQKDDKADCILFDSKNMNNIVACYEIMTEYKKVAAEGSIQVPKTINVRRTNVPTMKFSFEDIDSSRLTDAISELNMEEVASISVTDEQVLLEIKAPSERELI